VAVLTDTGAIFTPNNRGDGRAQEIILEELGIKRATSTDARLEPRVGWAAPGECIGDGDPPEVAVRSTVRSC
jgi:hypothetical protein